eukprot:SAG31_NODE_36526_length_312_cov_1.159624_1_plen_46_part_10
MWVMIHKKIMRSARGFCASCVRAYKPGAWRGRDVARTRAHQRGLVW